MRQKREEMPLRRKQWPARPRRLPPVCQTSNDSCITPVLSMPVVSYGGHGGDSTYGNNDVPYEESLRADTSVIAHSVTVRTMSGSCQDRVGTCDGGATEVCNQRGIYTWRTKSGNGYPASSVSLLCCVRCSKASGSLQTPEVDRPDRPCRTTGFLLGIARHDARLPRGAPE